MSSVLFFSAAGCAIFGVAELGVNDSRAALAFLATITLWAVGEVLDS